MAISNRTVTIKNVFASTAETNIPNPPVPGQSYRNTGLTAEEVGQGWPFKEIVDSAKFNEAMYEYTTICQQLEKYGFLPWSANTDYPAGGCALGTNGNVYQAKQATGPSTTSVDPVTDTSHTYWDLFYYGNVTANRALVSNGNGKLSASSTTATEIGYVHGVTSAIQTQLNKKANNNAVVHLSGTETITGAKTFTADIVISNDYPMITLKESDTVKGTNPSTEQFWGLLAKDSSNGAEVAGLGSFVTHLLTNGTVWSGFSAYKNVANSTDKASIIVYYPKTGNPYTYAPTPTDTITTSGTQIATTGWVNSTNNNVVHKSADETIAGTKTFTSDPVIKNSTPFLYLEDTAQTKGTAPSADVWGAVTFHDKNGNLMGRCRQIYSADKSNKVELQVHKANSSNDTDSSTMGIKYPASGSAYGYAPNSDVNGSVLTTVNKSKSSNGYFQLGNGMIVQWGRVTGITSNTETTVTFPKAFNSSTSYTIVKNYQSNRQSEAGDREVSFYSMTATSAKTFTASDDTSAFSWLAIGY